jgi:hypothetical protein
LNGALVVSELLGQEERVLPVEFCGHGCVQKKREKMFKKVALV